MQSVRRRARCGSRWSVGRLGGREFGGWARVGSTVEALPSTGSARPGGWGVGNVLSFEFSARSELRVKIVKEGNFRDKKIKGDGRICAVAILEAAKHCANEALGLPPTQLAP